MARVTHMEAVFDNGDKLILTLKEGTTFAGYKPATLYELFYAEYANGSHYDVYHTEYFPKSAYSNAKQAFDIRLSSNNPMNESDQGFNLVSILEKE